MKLRLLVALIATTLAACASRSTPPASPATAASTPPASTMPVPDGPITKESLSTYVSLKFPRGVAAGTITLDYGSGNVETELLEELRLMGFERLAQLDAIVPADYDQKGVDAVASTGGGTTTIAGLVRDLLIIHDTRGYFGKAWRNGWAASGPQDFPAPAAYGVDMDVLVELGVFGSESGDEGYDENPCGEGDDPCGDW